MLFIKHNSSTLYWQLGVKEMALIPHKARANQATHSDTEYTEAKETTRPNVSYFSLIMWPRMRVARGERHTFPSKTISYPSRSLILL